MKTSFISGACRGVIIAIFGLNFYGNCYAQSAESSAYMGAPVELVEAPNGAIANKKLLDRVSDFNFIQPTIEKLAEGVWQLGGYGLAPMSIIETDEGLIAFDTGDTVHDGELMLEAIRTFTQKPIKVIIYGHSHTVMGAGVIAEGTDIYWDADGDPVGGTAGTGCATTVSTDNTYMGKSVAAAGSSDETVRVRLDQ